MKLQQVLAASCHTSLGSTRLTHLLCFLVFRDWTLSGARDI